MFRGSSPIALDGKGRLAIPTKHRERLMALCGGRVVLAPDPTQGCLLLYPFPEWEIIERQINALPGMNSTARQLKMVMVGSAEEMELDSAGRILIPAMLRKFAGLDKDTVLAGQINKFALWSDTGWQNLMDQAAHMPDAIEAAVREGTLPEELKGFSL